jgi:hypothetical protein
VSLRVQIPVADFGGVKEFEFAHGAIIEQEGKSVAESVDTIVSTSRRTSGRCERQRRVFVWL